MKMSNESEEETVSYEWENAREGRERHRVVRAVQCLQSSEKTGGDDG